MAIMGRSLIATVALLALLPCIVLATQPPADFLHTYDIAPLLRVDRANRQSLSAVTSHPTLLPGVRSQSGHPVHANTAVFALTAFGQSLVLDLELNHDFIAPGYVSMADSEVVSVGVEHCYYRGSIVGVPSAHVSVSTCAGVLDGMIFYEGEEDTPSLLEGMAHGDTLVIEPARHYDLQSHTFTTQGMTAHPDFTTSDESAQLLYLVSALKNPPPPRECGNDDRHSDLTVSQAGMVHSLMEHSHPATPRAASSHVMRHTLDGLREEFTAVNGGGRRLLQVDPKYVELFLVSDVAQTTARGGVAGANTQALSVAAAVNVLYAKLTNYKIVVSVVATQAWTTPPAGIPAVTAATDITKYLEAFSTWAQTLQLTGPTAHDNAQLLVGTDLSASVAGVAWVSTMCRQWSSGVNEDSSSLAGKQASGFKVWTIETMTHEMGHNFGCKHDSDGNACISSGFVMAAVGGINPALTVSPKTWSTCSSTYITTTVQQIAGTPADCLKNSPRGLASGPVCGDGIITGAEECDTGISTVLCAADCKRKAGVQCTLGDCCDLTTGKIKPSGTVCRAAMHQCDLTDYCNGTAAACPQNDYKVDGTSCIEAGPDGKCYSGSCKGIEGQCREDFAQYASYGSWTRAPDACYVIGTTLQECGTLFCQLNNDGKCYQLQLNNDGIKVPQTVSENTPCASGTKVCKGVGAAGPGTAGSCVQPPAAALTCDGGCGVNGLCSTLARCVCNPGWGGALCDTRVTCSIDCLALDRHVCVADNICGTCLDRFASPNEMINSDCSLFAPQASLYIGSQAIFGKTPQDAFDDEPFSHFVSNFTASYIAGNVVYVGGKFPTAFTLVEYRVMSGNSRPAEDPRSWSIEGANSATPNAWTVVDTQTNIIFMDRHLTKSFFITCRKGAFDMYRMRVTAINDPTSNPSLQIAELYFYHHGSAAVVPSGCSSALTGAASSLRDSSSLVAVVVSFAVASLALTR